MIPAPAGVPSMTEKGLKDELHPAFLRRQWVVQRIGWALMLLIILLTIAGVFGTSPFAAKTQTRDVGDARYEVEYPRFTRYQLLDRMHVRVHAPSATGEELRLAFSTEWTESNSIRGTTPESDGGGVGADGGVYTYAVDDWSAPISIAVEYETRKAFRSPGTLTIAAGDLAPVHLPIDAWVSP